MLRHILLGTLIITGIAIGVPGSAYGQDTQQTDQSEEDWRNSRRKRKSNDDFDPITNPQGIGSGISLPPLEPIDTLPEDSRRHLQRQRAKVIAELEFGETPGDVPFEPSKAAKQDASLAAEEEEAWEVILTDLQGSAGGGTQQGEGGPNKVAVAGQGGGGSAPGSVTRGGSAQSAADILAQLKGLQTGNGRAQSGSSSPPQGTQQGGQSNQASGAQGQGPAQEGGQSEGDSSEGQANSEGQGQGQDGSDTGSGGDGADTGGEGTQDATNPRTPYTPTVDPLTLPERPGTPGDGRGTASSASDYLKGVTGQSQTEETEEDEQPKTED